jgi:hypothetical protein
VDPWRWPWSEPDRDFRLWQGREVWRTINIGPGDRPRRPLDPAP